VMASLRWPVATSHRVTIRFQSVAVSKRPSGEKLNELMERARLLGRAILVPAAELGFLQPRLNDASRQRLLMEPN
jgi:hypothetical protein